MTTEDFPLDSHRSIETFIIPLLSEQAYCHCESCQSFHSAPFTGVVGFPIKLEDGFADKDGK